jgi:hypothetical protein
MDQEKFQKAYAEIAKKDKAALAQLIIDYVQPQHITQNIVGMFLDTRALKPGDALD